MGVLIKNYDKIFIPIFSLIFLFIFINQTFALYCFRPAGCYELEDGTVNCAIGLFDCSSFCSSQYPGSTPECRSTTEYLWCPNTWNFICGSALCHPSQCCIIYDCGGAPSLSSPCPEGFGQNCGGRGSFEECRCNQSTPTSICSGGGTPGDVRNCSVVSQPNSCGQTQTCTGVQVCQNDGTWSSCSVSSCNPPSLPPGYGQSCNDGNSCTTGETIQCDGTCGGGRVSGTHNVCSGGQCISTPNTPQECIDQCSVNSDCTSCVPGVGQPCNDGNACTTGETIQCDGTCGGGNPLTCNDNNPCTNDSCNPSSGCQFTVVSGNHNECIGSSCGVVPNTSNVCTNQCSSNLSCNNCVPGVGQPCNDGNACTTGETIQCDGTCGGGNPLTCNDNNPCTNDSCNPSSGCQFTVVSGNHNECIGSSCGVVPNTSNSCTNQCNTPSDCATPQVSADIKANSSDGPISITYNTQATISWTSNNATNCSVSPGGWTGTSGFQTSGNLTSNRTYSLSCTGSGGQASDSVDIRILGASLSASPSSGSSALYNVSLTATVSGSSFGTFRYFFDCNSDGTIEKDSGDVWVNPYTANNLCSYTQPGTYTAKVEVWHNFGRAIATTSISVSSVSTSNFNLNVSITGSGKVTSNPPGIDCNPNCSAAFVSGASVTLQATPLYGFQFNRWSGDCSGTSLSCVLTMNADKSVTANFVSSPTPPPPPPPQTHLECNNQNQCVSVPGPGPDRCSTPRDCGFRGSNFAGKCQTQIINGLPVDYCADKECDPSIPGDCQSECRYDEDCGGPPGSSHLVCYNNACVIVGGPGQDNCPRIGQGCRPRIEEIIPLNPIPLDKFLKQVAGVWLAIDIGTK